MRREWVWLGKLKSEVEVEIEVEVVVGRRCGSAIHNCHMFFLEAGSSKLATLSTYFSKEQQSRNVGEKRRCKGGQGEGVECQKFQMGLTVPPAPAAIAIMNPEAQVTTCS